MEAQQTVSAENAIPNAKHPRFYTIIENDSRGVSFTIGSKLNREDGERLVAEGLAAGRKRTLVRERSNKRVTLRHPAREFLYFAICHICGHPAAAHGTDGKPCETCFMDALDVADHVDQDGEIITYMEPKCHRSRELALLDGIVDFAAERLSLRRVIEDPRAYCRELVVEPDPSGLGARLTRATEPPLVAKVEAEEDVTADHCPF
jgi:hypothetical protein